MKKIEERHKRRSDFFALKASGCKQVNAELIAFAEQLDKEIAEFRRMRAKQKY